MASRKSHQHTPGPGRRVAGVVWRTVQAFFNDNTARLGAALAFYTTIAVAPLLILAITVAGWFFDEAVARERVLGEIQLLAGPQAGEALEAVHRSASTETAITPTLLGLATLIFGALGVFRHLQDALNSIWRVDPSAGRGWKWFLRSQLFSLASVLVTGFLLLVSLIISATLSWLGTQLVGQLGLPVIGLQLTNFLLSLVMITCLFALIFRLLPQRQFPWRHVWLGSAVTGVLFTLGKTVLGFYLGHTRLTSAYGAAGSLIVLLLWSYYAAQIVFLGAQFTRIATLSHGGRDFSPLDTTEQQVRTAS
ncbi:MAG TPA: YihY/virulence factor BrkB family protein [Lacunisphaera sp.]